MTTEQARRGGRMVALTGAFVGLALALVAAAAPTRAAGAQKDDKKIEKKEFPLPAAGQKAEWVGAAVCQGCHTDPAANAALLKQTLGTEFVRLTENKVWGTHDLHSTAYKNILTSRAAEVKDGSNKANPTAQKMEDHLRRVKGENYTVSSDTACLACHSTVAKPVNEVPPSKWTPDSFIGIDGVGCEMCHGHGSLYQQKHQESRLAKVGAPPGAVRVVDWRDADPTVKEKWGLVDLRDAPTAATRCASCHVGNLAEGRFVTHDMFAAGHPPLPPLDLVAYTREQPRHWGLPSEMPYLKYMAEKHPDAALSVFHVREGESHVARRFVESTVATLRESVQLGGQLAATEQAKVEGLDYAAFDCASCHHNLKYPSDRQDRGYLGKPGRPLYRPATFALTKVVVAHAAALEGGADLKGSYEALLAAEKKLADAFTDKSLGDPAKVIAATGDIVKWSDDALKKLAAVRYTSKATQDLLAKLTDAARQEPKNPDPTKRPVADPEVAQLYTWAAETLLLDLVPGTRDAKDPKKVTPPKEVTELRKKLDGIVVTRLRPHAAFYYEVEGGTPGPTVQPVDERIGSRMDIFNSFQGAPFRKAFAELKPAFPK
jgi:hypothetical protein